ncbi:MAG: hypothetical protein K2X87_23455 [Gemmataceae bacterium]|nr:hypothetical protein [Gemmataceae bacterium]
MNRLIPTACLLLLGPTGCSIGPSPYRDGTRSFGLTPPVGTRTGPPQAAVPPSGVVRAGYSAGDPAAGRDGIKLPGPESAPTPSGDVALQDLIALTVERNPRLAQVGWAVETARGRAVQAGLYPNPMVSATGDELGDRTGPGGIWTAPYFQQEVVTGNKLGLSRAAALKEVDQAALRAVAERYRLFTEVRQNFFEVVAL